MSWYDCLPCFGDGGEGEEEAFDVSKWVGSVTESGDVLTGVIDKLKGK